MLAACDTGEPAQTRLPTFGPTAIATTAPPTSLPTLQASPTAAPWPPEWHDGFCAAYVDIVIAQQVARDIGRSLDADDRDNAIGLAHELQTSVAEIGGALTALPDWTPAADLVAALTAMLALDDDLATFYLRYLEDNRDAALARAQGAEDDLRGTAIPAVASALAPLVAEGFACAETPFELETP